MSDGVLFEGGFGRQDRNVSPAFDLFMAFTDTPGADGAPNRLRWYGRRLTVTLHISEGIERCPGW